jgi:tetratricopeptide (TPR) repeat protein
MWGDYLQLCQKHHAALRHYQKASTEFEKLGLKISQAETLGRISEVLLNLGQMEAAWQANEIALNLAKPQGKRLLIMPRLLTARAAILTAMGQVEEAQQTERQARKIRNWQLKEIKIYPVEATTTS